MPTSGFPTASGSRPETVAVVGAGVVGLCTALAAQRQGYRVTLIDRDEPGRGASFGNAGYLATELIDPLATLNTLRAAPGLWLHPHGPLALPLTHLPRLAPWLIRFVRAARPAAAGRGRQALRALNRASVPAWQRCLREIDALDQLVPGGYLLVWESPAKRAEAQAHARYLHHWGIRTEWAAGDKLAQLEPDLAGQLSHALFFPEAQRVREPYQLCRQLFAAFRARGGVYRREVVRAVSPQAEGLALQLASGALGVDRAILCAGAWSKPLLHSVGLEVPLEAERGYHLTYPGAPVKLRHPIGSAERRFVMSPLDSGLRAVGMSELGGLNRDPNPRRFAALRHHSRALLPGLNDPALTVSEWMGHRPTLPDSLPVIDRHPRHPRLLFAFGHQHLGLTQAAISAELVVDLLAGKPPALDLTPFRVGRF